MCTFNNKKTNNPKKTDKSPTDRYSVLEDVNSQQSFRRSQEPFSSEMRNPKPMSHSRDSLANWRKSKLPNITNQDLKFLYHIGKIQVFLMSLNI